MNKCKEKAPYRSYNAKLINALIEKYGVSSQFVRQSLRGERTSRTSNSIKLEYENMEAEINKTLKKL